MATSDLNGFRPSWIEIDLATIRGNINEIQRHVGSDTAVMAVVKANAYAHGLVTVAQESIKAGAAMLGVAIVNEAVTLRQNGVESPILVMGCVLPEEAARIVSNDISQVVSSLEIIQALSKEAEKQGKRVKVHVKVDSGMGRVGIPFQEAANFIQQAIRLPNIELEGVMTHFASADEPDDSEYTRRQLDRFTTVIRDLERQGIAIKYRHAANSAGLLFFPESHLDLVRPGLSIYGISPTPQQFKIPLRPALSLYSRITQIKNVETSESIGYGRTFKTKRRSLLGVVPLGYGDGFSRKHSNRGKIIVNGEFAPIIGNISMDQFVVDLTDVTTADLGVKVVLIGKQGGREINAWDLAKEMESIPYEVLATLGPRIPRHYSN